MAPCRRGHETDGSARATHAPLRPAGLLDRYRGGAAEPPDHSGLGVGAGRRGEPGRVLGAGADALRLGSGFRGADALPSEVLDLRDRLRARGAGRRPGARVAPMTLARRVANAELLVLGVLGWIAFVFLTIVTVAAGWELTTGGVRQVDWHVYVAGARDLLAHRLYAVPLDIGGLVLSATQFNLPPLSAVWAVPLLPLPIEVGGEVWQLIAAASIAITAVLTTFIVGVRRPLLAAGAILGPLSFSIVYLEGLHLGTNNYLVLAMVGGFAWLMLRRRDRWAGLALGLAIGTKGWPVALVVPMVRERRWRVLGWAAATVLLQAVVFLLWLGPGFPVRM